VRWESEVSHKGDLLGAGRARFESMARRCQTLKGAQHREDERSGTATPICVEVRDVRRSVRDLTRHLKLMYEIILSASPTLLSCVVLMNFKIV